MQITPSQSRQRSNANRIMFALGLLALGMGIFASFDERGQFDLHGLIGNLSSELIGAIFTYYIIERIVKNSADSAELKPRMIRRLENPDRGVTWQVLQELDDRGWLQDGSLYGWFLQRANFEGADLRKINANAFGLYRCNLKDAKIDVEQLVVMSDLRRTVMPDGKLYDGRYCLVGDLNWALTRYGIDVNHATHEQMAAYYDVSLSDYLEGQRWAQAHLAEYAANVPDYLRRFSFKEGEPERNAT